MCALREEIIKHEGKGILKPQNIDPQHIEIPVRFECQYRDGSIKGTITLIEENHTHYMELYHLNLKYKIFCLSANLDGEELNIEPLVISMLSTQIITFIADCLKLKHREISSASNKMFCKFNVPNFKSINTIKEGKVTFSNYNGDIREDIEISKKSDIMGVVRIELNDNVKLQSIEEYKRLLFKKIDKILRLVSLFQGTRIDWTYFELYEQNNEGEYKVYSEGRIQSEFSARDELKFSGDLSNYIKKTYPKYTDKLDTDFGFYPAVEWYCESLNRNLLESKYVGLFTVLESVIYRFAITKDKEFILNETDFEIFRDELKKKMKKDCNVLGICDKEIRGALKSNLKCLNRYSFKNNLTRFLDNYEIKYRDIIEDLGDLREVRDNITHIGLSERDFEALNEQCNKLRTFVQRIFFSILNY
jgi:hypothetical protein